jgi:aldehyde dehydrogenase (NAD+)
MASATQACSEIEAGNEARTAHGVAGFRAFSHDRTLLRNRFLLLPLLFPPGTPRVMRLIHLIKHGLG